MKSMNTIQSSSTILVKQDMRKSAIEPGNSYQYKSRYQSKFLNSSNQWLFIIYTNFFNFER